MELKMLGGNSIEVSESAFGREFNEALVHQAVVAYLAAGRSGSKRQKTRTEVSGGGAKPWRQKGTGRARAGSSRSPIWRHGGKVFAARPRSYEQKLNKKMYRAAMQSILSRLLREDRIKVVDELSIPEPKTKLLAARLSEIGLSDVLIVIEGEDQRLALASRNIPAVGLLPTSHLNPVDLISFDSVLMTEPALRRVESAFS